MTCIALYPSSMELSLSLCGPARRARCRILEKILTNESIAVEGRLMIIPVNNIKTMEVSLAPEKLPAMVIREARMDLVKKSGVFWVSFSASCHSDQEVHLYEALLPNLCDLIVTLLYFVKMKATQLPNMLGIEPVSPGF